MSVRTRLSILLSLPVLTIVSPAAAQESRSGEAPRGHTEADVRFVQGMIVHHAQAIVMAGLVSDRTPTRALRLLAERIDVSQRDEIASMARWLTVRREPVPAWDAPHHHHGADSGMAGMATPAELEQLRGASGAAFDRLLLQLMIRHHEGALTMVAALFASAGAVQDPELFGFASDVDADQRAEIRRMRALLETLPSPPQDPS